MAKTIILGNKASIELASKINAELVEVADLYDNDLGVINDFVVNTLKQDFDVLVIDVDNIQRGEEVALAIGLYMRLSFTEIGKNSLNPIIIASDKSIKLFLKHKTYSQLLLTKNVYFQPRQCIILDAVTPLEANMYQNDFLDSIYVQAGPKTGRHSLANQWGASVLDKLLNLGIPSGNPILNTA